MSWMSVFRALVNPIICVKLKLVRQHVSHCSFCGLESFNKYWHGVQLNRDNS